MSRSKKNIKPYNEQGGVGNWRILKVRKMKPYCLTGDKRNMPAWIDHSTSYEDYENIGDAKKARAELKTEKKVEKHRTRQQAKNKLRKDLDLDC